MESINKTILIIYSLVLGLAGCAGSERGQNQGLSLPVAELPNYQVGEYYIYDNTLITMVTEKDSDMLKWNNGGNATIQANRDFTLPWLVWDDGQSSYITTLFPQSPPIWPLVAGKIVRYQSLQKITSKSDGQEREISRDWKCMVETPERIEVPAGDFDTHVISCKRYSGGDGGWRGTEKYYYAPSIGHYVQVERSFADRSRSVNRLTEYGFNSTLLSSGEQADLRSKLNAVLNNPREGLVEVWKSKDRTTGAMLSATSMFFNKNQQCRKYKGTYNISGKIRSHERVICRDEKGNWSSP